MRRLFALHVQNGKLYPAFQLDGTQVREDVLCLVGILRASADPFTIAQWLRTPLVEAEDRTPLELLDTGESPGGEPGQAQRILLVCMSRCRSMHREAVAQRHPHPDRDLSTFPARPVDAGTSWRRGPAASMSRGSSPQTGKVATISPNRSGPAIWTAATTSLPVKASAPISLGLV